MGFKKFILYVEIIYEVFTKEGAVCAAPEFCVFTFIEDCSVALGQKRLEKHQSVCTNCV